MSVKSEKRDGLPIAVKNLLRGTKDPYAHISVLRQTLAPKHLPALSRWLHSFGVRSQAFQVGRRPRQLRHLRGETRVLGPIDPVDELDWAADWICYSSEFLTRFINARREVEMMVLGHDSETCLTALDQFEANLCFSQWGIDYRLLLLQNGRGLEGKKLSWLKSGNN